MEPVLLPLPRSNDLVLCYHRRRTDEHDLGRLRVLLHLHHEQTVVILMKIEIRVTTMTGSAYTVTQDDDGIWWLRGDHLVITKESQAISGRLWMIAQPRPWPLVLGKSAKFISTYFNSPDHPDRMPGGGKIISQVRSLSSNVS